MGHVELYDLDAMQIRVGEQSFGRRDVKGNVTNNGCRRGLRKKRTRVCSYSMFAVVYQLVFYSKRIEL